MITHRIKKGFDVRLAGVAERSLKEAAEPAVVAILAKEFLSIKPKLLVREGDKVRSGDPLFMDKRDRQTMFLSPATGTVTKIFLGPRRRLRRVEVTQEGNEEFADLPAAQLDGGDRASVVAAIKAAGLWQLIRQRPVGKIANGEIEPKAIYVNAMDTEPLAADPVFATQGAAEDLQAGIAVLKALCSGKIYVTLAAGSQPAEYSGLQGVELHGFEGPHPAGLVGTHIDRIDPIRAGEAVWYLKAQELRMLGQWQRSSQFPTHRVVAVAGSQAPERGYYRVRSGAALTVLTGGKVLGDQVRIVNGTALHGTAIEADSFLGSYAQTLTALPSGGDKRDFFGWLLPNFSKQSASRSTWSWLMPRKEYDLDDRLHGGPRGIVDIGASDRVMPLDILPTQLIRSIQANDIEEALSLGLLEVTEEDLALCTFVDPSKLDFGKVIRQGLDLYETEG